MRLSANVARSAGVVVLAVATLLCTIGQTGPPYWFIYASDKGSGKVYIYKYYPSNNNVSYYAEITGLKKPEGMCTATANGQSDVFITEGGASKIRGYHHGATTPFITFDDPGYYPMGCSVDNGDSLNLAVSNLRTEPADHRGSIAIYPNGGRQLSASPVAPWRIFTNPLFHRVYYVAYSYAFGNLYLVGTKPNGSFVFGAQYGNAPIIASTPAPLLAAMSSPSKPPGGILDFQTGGIVISDRASPFSKLVRFVRPSTVTGTTAFSGAGGVTQFDVRGQVIFATNVSGGNYTVSTYPGLTLISTFGPSPHPSGFVPSGIAISP